MGRRTHWAVGAAALAGAAAVAAASAAVGAFPGENGAIVYVRAAPDDFVLDTVKADGTGRSTLLVLAGQRLDHPAWAADGKKLAFDDGIDLYVRPAGSEAKQVVAGAQQPAWSPDGKRLAYVVHRAGKGPAIVVANADGSASKTLYAGAKGGAVAPAWSPGGKSIAFTRTLPSGGATPKYDVMVVSAGGGAAKALTHDGKSADSSWSPEGKRIAFRSLVGGNSNLKVMNADGSGTKQLTSGAGNVSPAWSPDGEWIAYIHAATSSVELGGDLYLVRPDGSGRKRLRRCPDALPEDPPATTKGYCSAPDWQPLPA